ncbi:LamG domain-containing protein [Pseudoalteromonas sp. S16_S37]|uniref:LamG domain-containing protein n=1 Tax=Pseudoalteromonas sp. S16_S37 TaxID=2720228 RepID=UPI001681A65C|nr:LamG domain-containing protein [Pseudoalteromonas sp. S16_S37]MBD1582592.1 LamG domain-containing protein [Pseudoalteromonas sp. S16_S37]
MALSKYQLAFLAAGLVCAPLTSVAQMYRVTFSGHVSEVNDPHQLVTNTIKQGGVISGEYWYDDQMHDLSANPNYTAQSTSAGIRYQASVDGLSLSMDKHSPSLRVVIEPEHAGSYLIMPDNITANNQLSVRANDLYMEFEANNNPVGSTLLEPTFEQWLSHNFYLRLFDQSVPGSEINNTRIDGVLTALKTEPLCTALNTVTLSDSERITVDGRLASVNGKGNEQLNPSELLTPGAVLCVKGAPSGASNELRIENVAGSADAPITLINTGGQVVFKNRDNSGYIDTALEVLNSQHLRITGSGNQAYQYGFTVDGRVGTVRKGVSYYKRSSDIEMDHFEVGYTTQSGVNLKTFSNCSDGSVPARYAEQNETPQFYDAYNEPLVLHDTPEQYQKEHMHDYNNDGAIDQLDASGRNEMAFYNASIHHNYIHNTGTEGMYIGSNGSYRLYKATQHPDPFHLPGSGMGDNERRICQYYQAPDKQQQVAFGDYNEPMAGQLVGVKIYSNQVDRTGWDSINVKSSAVSCEIFDNHVTNFSTKNYDRDQIGAISLQTNTYCDVYRNTLEGGDEGGYGLGIHAPTIGGVIANNVIKGAGKGGRYGKEAAIQVRFNTEDDHHKMYDERDQHIPWQQIYAGKSHNVINNTIIDAVKESVDFRMYRETHSIANNLIIPADTPMYVAGDVVVVSNLNTSSTVLEVGTSLPYALASGTAAVNTGTDMANDFGIDGTRLTKDLVNVTRPLQGAYDIGALEYVTLRVLANSGGRVVSNPNGIECPTTCGHAFAEDQLITLFAIADSDHDFLGWDGCDQVVDGRCEVTGHKIVTANFAPKFVRISTFADENGDITPNGPISVARGAQQVVTMVPAPLHKVVSLSVDGEPVEPVQQYTFDNLTAHHVIEARFGFDQSYAHLVSLQLDEMAGNVAVNSGALTSVNGIVEGATWTADGYQQGALHFDGDDYVNLGSHELMDVDPAQHSFTATLWFRTTTSGALISKVKNSTSEIQFYLFAGSNGALYSRVGVEGNTYRTIRSDKDTIDDGQWHFAALVNDHTKNEFTLYLDGQKLGSKLSGLMPSNGMDILIGARRDGDNQSTSNHFDGDIDNVGFYKKALTNEEVQALFTGN